MRLMPPLIAVIDDDVAIATLVHEVLTDEGYRTLCLHEAQEVSAALVAHLPDVVVMDWHMRGGVSGWALLQTLRQHPATASIPVLVCSGDALFLRTHQDELRALGCEMLHKPFDLGDLLSGIAALLPVLPPDGNA